MKISKKGFNLICEFEGFSAKSYKCPAGIWTIGWGTTFYPTGKSVGPNETCTKEQADIWLLHEINEKSAYLNIILESNNIVLNQNEYDALVSITYNCGSGILNKNRSLGEALLSKDKSKISEAFLLYCKVTLLGIKTTSKGLLARRQAERRLFLEPL